MIDDLPEINRAGKWLKGAMPSHQQYVFVPRLTVLGGQIWYMLPRLRFVGVDPSLTYAISQWARGLWPAGNWNLNDAATCTRLQACTSD